VACPSDDSGGGGCDGLANDCGTGSGGGNGDPCDGGATDCGNVCDSCGDTYDFYGNCPAGGNGGGGGPNPTDPCATAGCEYDCVDYYRYGQWFAECEAEADPVIVSLDGSQFPLTNEKNGVRFDFYGDQKPVSISWTAAGANVGWLTLDLNRNGTIDNGLELFTNVTPQPGLAGTHTGFKALANWDSPANGGNGDGRIDAKDRVFSQLRIWVDRNHNGVSEPSELLTMQQAGIQAISVQSLPDNWTDPYGNRFRNRARIVWAGRNHGAGHGQGGDRSRWAYDVVLLSSR
jgi:hypothetical protein